MADIHPIKRALISVSDKTGLVEFATRLAALNIELVSTGGTARALREAGLEVRDVSELTEFPEMMDGRIKTLHPRVHGGLLALRDNAEHRRSMSEHGIADIDLLVVNLYPFEETVKAGSGYDACVENIDIGGPAMIRAAAKNHQFVSVVTDHADYDAVGDEIERAGGLSYETKQRLAAAAYAATAAYDSAIAGWFRGATGETFPPRLSVAGRLSRALRYGENPHQQAAFYVTDESRPGVASARQTQGKAVSYNNLGDADAAFELVSEFDAKTPAVAIIKHANPCGAAVAGDLVEAYEKALRCDPVSAFGGVVALNQKLTASIAAKITEIFTEVVIAPDADEAALETFAKKKNLIVLLTGGPASRAEGDVVVKTLAGGFLAQTRDTGSVSQNDLNVVTKRAPTGEEMRDLLFAFTVAKHVKSNAIVYAKDGATVGVGAGQMSRLDSSRIAAHKAIDAAKACDAPEPLTKGAVVASDAFFPFADGMLAAVDAGATAVIQPGGSKRDEEVIKAADEAGVAMVFTGLRHFRH